MQLITSCHYVILPAGTGYNMTARKAMKSGTKKVFELSESGLFYLHASAELARSKSAATVLVNTVEDNKTSDT